MANSKVTKLPSGHTVEYVDGEEFDKLKVFKHFELGAVRLLPGGCLVKAQMLEVADKLYNFQFRPSDVVITSSEKCGTTWLQEILWNMAYNPNLDHPSAGEDTFFKCPFFDFDTMFSIDEMIKSINVIPDIFKSYMDQPDLDASNANMFNVMEALPNPRILRTHFTPSMLNPKLLETAKVINITRNPKDVLLSNYHFSKLMNHISYKGSLEEFAELFISGKLIYLPYDEHLREIQKFEGHKNILRIFYEDLKKDTFGEIKRIDKFLNFNLTDKQIQNVVDHTSIAAMKKRNENNIVKQQGYNEGRQREEGGFFREDKDKKHAEKLSPEFEKKFKEWAQENLKDLDLPYKF